MFGERAVVSSIREVIRLSEGKGNLVLPPGAESDVSVSMHVGTHHRSFGRCGPVTLRYKPVEDVSVLSCTNCGWETEIPGQVRTFRDIRQALSRPST